MSAPDAAGPTPMEGITAAVTAEPTVQRALLQKTNGAATATGTTDARASDTGPDAAAAPTNGATKARLAAPNTREFLSRVLPWPDDDTKGFCNTHVTGTGQDGKKFWSGTPCRDVDGFLQVVHSYATWTPPPEVYMCMSRQSETKPPNKDGKIRAAKSQANALALRSIYLDVDVKPTAFPTLGDAEQALREFCKQVPIPLPTALVGSGGGMHAHWISDRDLKPEEWQPYAEGLKQAALKFFGNRIDAGVTGDSARVLRVPGTFNYKLTNNPRPVKLLYLAPKDYHFETALSVLPTIAPAVTTPKPIQAPVKLDRGTMSPLFAGHPAESLAEGIGHEAPPVDITAAVSAGCGWLKEALDTGGANFSNGLWMLTTLAATFAENGHALAHDMARGHPGYIYAETDALWDRKVAERQSLGLGWPSCAAIQGEGSKHCASCPHLAKGKSPLHLARISSRTSAPHLAASPTSVPAPNPRTQVPFTGWPDGCDKHGTPVRGYANTLAAFRRLGIEFTYDTFRQKEYSSGHKIKMLDGELTDSAVTMLRDRVRSDCGFYPDKEITREAITAECLRNRVNPVTDYFDQLVWDGTPRLSKFLHRYLGADDTPLNSAIGVKLMCAIVRRAKKPGCKYDHEVVLQADQGVRKSMFCEDLAVFPDLFTDAGDLAGSIKEQMEIAQGKQIIEFPELAGFNQNSRERNKAFLSRRVDRARLAYAHYARDEPRSSVPIGTTNPGGYLNDPTGERRYWHVAARKYDREGFLANKDQLYAEAVAREPNENLWLDTPELVAAHDAIVATVKEPNALVDELADLRGEAWETGRDKIAGGWTIHREERVSNKDVRGKLLLLAVDAMRIRDFGRRISDAMMTLGWTKVSSTLVCKHGGSPEGGYRRPLADVHVMGPAGNTGLTGAQGNSANSANIGPTSTQGGVSAAPGGTGNNGPMGVHGPGGAQGLAEASLAGDPAPPLVPENGSP